MKQYTKQEINKIFDALVPELRRAVLSPDTANSIQKISQTNGIKDKNISIFATLVGDVLMGLLPTENFVESLKQELKIDKNKGEKILQEVDKLILSPVQNYISALYGKAPAKTEIKKMPAENADIDTEKSQEKDADVYREPIA